MNKILKDNHKYLQNKKNKSRRYSASRSDSSIMMGCADTDFEFCDAIKEQIINIVQKGDLSYTFFDDEFFSVVKSWYEKVHHIKDLEFENFINGSGVMHLIQVALDTIGQPGDRVIVQPPVYGPFYDAIAKKGMFAIHNNLVYNKNDNQYYMDFKDLEEKCQLDGVVAILLCSPHNPIGRVWNKDELTKVKEITHKYGVKIIADEIWCEIVWPGIEFKSMLDIDPTAVIMHSVGKTFNLGGARLGFALSRDKHLIKKMNRNLERTILYASANYLSYNMLLAGYTKPGAMKWYIAYRDQLRDNFYFLKENIEKYTDIKVVVSHGTSVVCLDMSAYCKTEEEVNKIFEKMNIFGSEGSIFGDNFDLFFRLEIGFCEVILKELINRFKEEFYFKK